MNQLSDTLSRLSESATLAMSAKAREMKEQGIEVINLSLGEPDFATPDYIKEAAKKAVDDNFTKYPPVPGYKDVLEAISQKLKRDNNLDFSPSQIVISNGAKQTIANIVLSLVSSGEEVLLPIPYWVSYAEIVKLANGKIKTIETDIENNFKITPQQLEDSITENSRMIIFSSPCNPSGSVYSQEELEALVKVIEKYPNLYVVSDEIYELINFTGQAHHSIAQFESIKDQVIVVNGVSKGFSMTGWRIGYMAAPQWIAKACIKIQGQFTSGACGIAQKAAKEAVMNSPEKVVFMRDKFCERRDLMIEKLSEIEGIKVNIPEGAFYIFPDISAFLGKSFNGKKINNATDLCEFLLVEANVACVTGVAFGSPNYIRISYATDEKTLLDACRKIKSALANLV